MSEPSNPPANYSSSSTLVQGEKASVTVRDVHFHGNSSGQPTQTSPTHLVVCVTNESCGPNGDAWSVKTPANALLSSISYHIHNQLVHAVMCFARSVPRSEKDQRKLRDLVRDLASCLAPKIPVIYHFHWVVEGAESVCWSSNDGERLSASSGAHFNTALTAEWASLCAPCPVENTTINLIRDSGGNVSRILHGYMEGATQTRLPSPKRLVPKWLFMHSGDTIEGEGLSLFQGFINDLRRMFGEIGDSVHQELLNQLHEMGLAEADAEKIRDVWKHSTSTDMYFAVSAPLAACVAVLFHLEMLDAFGKFVVDAVEVVERLSAGVKRFPSTQETEDQQLRTALHVRSTSVATLAMRSLSQEEEFTSILPVNSIQSNTTSSHAAHKGNTTPLIAISVCIANTLVICSAYGVLGWVSVLFDTTSQLHLSISPTAFLSILFGVLFGSAVVGGFVGDFLGHLPVIFLGTALLVLSTLLLLIFQLASTIPVVCQGVLAALVMLGAGLTQPAFASLYGMCLEPSISRGQGFLLYYLVVQPVSAALFYADSILTKGWVMYLTCFLMSVVAFGLTILLRSPLKGKQLSSQQQNVSRRGGCWHGLKLFFGAWRKSFKLEHEIRQFDRESFDSPQCEVEAPESNAYEDVSHLEEHPLLRYARIFWSVFLVFPFVVYWVAYAQMYGLWIIQGKEMTPVKHLSPSLFFAINCGFDVVFGIVSAVLHYKARRELPSSNSFFFLCASWYGNPLNRLKFGAGACFCSVGAALIMQMLVVFERQPSVALQVIQYALLSLSEICIAPTLFQIVYGYSPAGVRGRIGSLLWGTIGIGAAIQAALVWVPDKYGILWVTIGGVIASICLGIWTAVFPAMDKLFTENVIFSAYRAVQQSL